MIKLTPLTALIAYWRANYAINHIKRSPTTNNHILSTIKYLERLEAGKPIQLNSA